MRPGKQIAGGQKYRDRQHGWDEEPAEGGLIAAADEEDAAHHQWSGNRAELVERLMQPKSPAEPSLARGMRQHRIAHRRADAATHALGNDQHSGDLPSTGERQERYGEQVEQIPGDGNCPIPPRPVAEITRDEPRAEAQQLAKPGDNSDRRRGGAERTQIRPGDAARPLISHVAEEADDPQKDDEQDSTLPREGPVWRIRRCRYRGHHGDIIDEYHLRRNEKRRASGRADL